MTAAELKAAIEPFDTQTVYLKVRGSDELYAAELVYCSPMPRADGVIQHVTKYIMVVMSTRPGEKVS